MTDETDIRSDDADSGRSVDDKAEAEIIAKSGPTDDPDVYLVEYPDGEQAYEPATPSNVALFEDGLFERIQGYSAFTIRAGGESLAISLDADVGNDEYVITVEDETLPVPTEYVEDVIDVFNGTSGAATGSRLYKLYKEILSGQVRRHAVQSFVERFPDDRVEVTPDGWIIDDTFIVNYEAENYLVENDTVYVRSGGDMVQADETKEAVELHFDVAGSAEIPTPDGNTIEATEREQEFLATVESLLFPEDYLDADLVDGIEQAKAESFADDIESIAETASVSGFTDSKTGNYHRHGFDKHRAIDEAAVGNLDASLGMTEEAIDKLYFNDYDHAACHELLARRTEFENAPFDIFEDKDAENDDFSRWKAIERAKESAPVSDETHRKIREMFGDDEQSTIDQY